VTSASVREGLYAPVMGRVERFSLRKAIADRQCPGCRSRSFPSPFQNPYCPGWYHHCSLSRLHCRCLSQHHCLRPQYTCAASTTCSTTASLGGCYHSQYQRRTEGENTDLLLHDFLYCMVVGRSSPRKTTHRQLRYGFTKKAGPIHWTALSKSIRPLCCMIRLCVLLALTLTMLLDILHVLIVE
jgi:hypothetical protein